MVYNRCGESGLKLPIISLGLWHNFGDVDNFETARAIIHYAFDAGITHFDLANNYGPSPGSAEENFGKVLKSDMQMYRDEMIISTKAGYLMWPGAGLDVRRRLDVAQRPQDEHHHTVGIVLEFDALAAADGVLDGQGVQPEFLVDLGELLDGRVTLEAAHDSVFQGALIVPRRLVSLHPIQVQVSQDGAHVLELVLDRALGTIDGLPNPRILSGLLQR